MRILIATAWLPWPLRTGGNAAQFSTLQCLAEDHDFTLVCRVYTTEQLADASELAKRLPRVRVSTAYCGVPEPRRWSVAWFRRQLRRAANTVGLFLRSTSSPEASEAPCYPFYPLPRVFIDTLYAEIARGVDLIQVEFAEMMSLGAVLPRSIPKLFIHHQIHSVYFDRFVAAHGRAPYLEYLAAKVRAEERCFLHCFDAIVAFSAEDQRAIRELSGTANVWVSPYPVPSDIGIAQRPPLEFGGHFVFVGSEEHDPNRDALRWLLDEIWPAITAEIADARLVIIGPWSGTWRSRYASAAVSFTGFVDDLSAYIRGSIMLVPLRIGSGIRTKIIAAMAQGVPVISTTIGGEGLPARHGQEFLAADSAHDFATAASRLTREPDLWRHLTACGLQMVSLHYSPDEVRRTRNRIYTMLQVRQSSHP